jgi:hypothetical protein
MVVPLPALEFEVLLPLELALAVALANGLLALSSFQGVAGQLGSASRVLQNSA